MSNNAGLEFLKLNWTNLTVFWPANCNCYKTVNICDIVIFVKTFYLVYMEICPINLCDGSDLNSNESDNDENGMS